MTDGCAKCLSPCAKSQGPARNDGWVREVPVTLREVAGSRPPRGLFDGAAWILRLRAE